MRRGIGRVAGEGGSIKAEWGGRCPSGQKHASQHYQFNYAGEAMGLETNLFFEGMPCGALY
jgi:hypothetical protein